jgi:diaminopimelate decarboxylase
MNLVAQKIIDSYFKVKDNTLFIRDNSIADIVKQYSTPIYLYDLNIIKQKLDTVKTNLPFCDVYYSVKANPHKNIISFFVNNNCGTEIASLGEFEKSIIAGNSPDKIIYAGPGKRSIDLYSTLKKGIAEIHLESFSEITRCNECAKQLNKIQNVSIRINPSNQFQTGAIQMGGKPIAFGFDEELLNDAVNAIKRCANLKLSGLHIYAGTQILDSISLSKLYLHAFNLCENIVKNHGIAISTLDLGGGFGVPYYEDEEPLNIENLGNTLKIEYQKLIRREKALANLKIIIEPGRYLTAESGLYITSVVDVKQSRDKHFAICDGGMNHNLAASGNLGQIIKRNFPIICANKINIPDDHNYEICGPLCTPLDVIGRNVKMPKLDEGDIVVLFNAGAYGLSASPTGFLSHDVPKEIFID